MAENSNPKKRVNYLERLRRLEEKGMLDGLTDTDRQKIIENDYYDLTPTTGSYSDVTPQSPGERRYFQYLERLQQEGKPVPKDFGDIYNQFTTNPNYDPDSEKPGLTHYAEEAASSVGNFFKGKPAAVPGSDEFKKKVMERAKAQKRSQK